MNSLKLWLISLTCFLCIYQSTEFNPGPVITTQFGQLQGFSDLATDSEKIDIFLGIPFAQPPVDELRFEKPVAPHKWKGIRAATKQTAACVPHARPLIDWMQKEFSEDCLYLNVFTPHRSPTSPPPNKLLPVLVIIHGGGYVQGSALRYSNYKELGRKYVLEGIVVVTIQYRLGVAGFASSGDMIFPGNYGLWDQLMAIRFLRDNIRQFGGDHKQITLFGYSAGSSSVSALGLSPHSRDYFKQAIQMSGSVFAAWTTSDRVANETHQLGKVLNCNVEESVELKRCLKTKSFDQIFDAVNIVGPTRMDVNFVKFGPRFDGVFFPRDYPELIQESTRKPTIMGFTEQESLYFTLLPNRNTTLAQLAIPWERFDTYGEADLTNFVRNVVANEAHFGVKASKVQEKILNYYLVTAKAKNSNFYLEKYTQLLSDIQFIIPIIWESRIKAQFQWPLFLYFNTYFNKRVFPQELKIRANFHSNDHNYLFKKEDSPFQFDAQDRVIEDFLVRSVVNFLKKGNPSTNDIRWPVTTPEIPMRYLKIKENRPEVGDLLMLDRLKFWLTLVENYPQYNIIRGSIHSEYGHEEL